MIHPLIRLLATRPQLLAEHFGAYVQLASAEAGEAAEQLRRRALLGTVLLAGSVLAATFAGVAVMLLAVVPIERMPMPWLLATVPLAPAAVALGCWLALRQRPTERAFGLLREQLSIDARLLHEAGEA